MSSPPSSQGYRVTEGWAGLHDSRVLSLPGSTPPLGKGPAKRVSCLCLNPCSEGELTAPKEVLFPSAEMSAYFLELFPATPSSTPPGLPSTSLPQGSPLDIGQCPHFPGLLFSRTKDLVLSTTPLVPVFMSFQCSRLSEKAPERSSERETQQPSFATLCWPNSVDSSEWSNIRQAQQRALGCRSGHAVLKEGPREGDAACLSCPSSGGRHGKCQPVLQRFP